MTLSPASAPAGQPVTARATGFTPGETVEFQWSSPAGSGQPVTTTADTKGATKIDITPGTTPGQYTISAKGLTSNRSASRTVTVTKAEITLSLSASSVAAGEKFTVSARGFDDGEEVTFTLDDSQLGKVTAKVARRPLRRPRPPPLVPSASPLPAALRTAAPAPPSR
ncbi:hypothetical protein [Acrocarpospora catenulata]|uniref:hypothetical protein n=1 Tax=Acrocarpospora catenulata TaxID=2836182 RepID=UPI001BD92F97|nr:hypothetical protein [Acrocarpospora catenulata]